MLMYPRLFESGLKKRREPGQKAYFVMTCGDDIGAAGQYLQSYAKTLALNFMALALL